MISLQVSGASELVVQMQDLPLKVSRSMVRATNRAISAARTVMVRAIAADVGLKASAVRDALPMTEATPSRIEARLAASLKRIPLMDFGAKDTGVNRGTGRRSNTRIPGVRSRVGRGVTYKLGGSKNTLPNAFIATMASGHTGVFMRAGKKRLPIRELFGPSLGHVFGKYRPQGLARAQEMFETTFAHELEVRGDSGSVDAGAD